MIPQKYYDYIVIGAGSGGLTVAAGLRALNKNFLIISKTVGGDCTQSGCVPSKSLLHLSQQYHLSENKEFKDNLKQVIFQEVRRKIDEFITEDQTILGESSFIQGAANFVSSNKITVKVIDNSCHDIEFKRCIVSSGSSPVVIGIKGLSTSKVLTNETIFSVQSVPSSLTILGGGPIGCEMATAFARLGTKVTIITRSSILDREPRETAEQVELALKRLGVEIYTGYTADRVENDQLVIKNSLNQVKMLTDAELYLMALGRQPNVDFGLENAGIKFDRKLGIEVDHSLRTSQKHIYAIGDCTTSLKFTHLANNQGRRVIQSIVFPLISNKKSVLPWVTFTHPALASVGQTKEDTFVKMFKVDFSRSDRARIEEKTGLVGVVFVHMLTGKIVGASIAGDFSEHIINFFTLAIQNKTTVFSLLLFIVPYPTYFSSINQLSTQFLQQFKSNLKNNIITLIKLNMNRIVASVFWFVVVVSFLIYFSNINFSTSVLTRDLDSLFKSEFGILLFILAYCLRPFLFFSATILSVLAGNIYGFGIGLIITILASNLSSIVAYLVGKTIFSTQKQEISSGLRDAIRVHPFNAVLIARLTFVPYDLVSYVAGALRINIVAFIAATALGSLIGSIAIVSFGAGLENIYDYQNFKIKPELIVTSFAVVLVSLVLSYVLKKLK